MQKSDKSKVAPTVNVVKFASCEVYNENGSRVKLGQIWQKQTTVFVFLRHFACIACRAHASQVWNEREKYEAKGAKIVFVGNGQPHFIKKFKEHLNIQAAVIYTDPLLESFKAAGFKRGFLAALGPSAVMNGIKLMNAEYSQGKYSKDAGDLWQLGGVIVVRPSGEIPFHYISQAMGDFPPEKDVPAEAPLTT